VWLIRRLLHRTVLVATPHAVRERVARWGTTGRLPAGMIERQSAEDRKWDVLSERPDLREVAA
jgi:hypothetical protein